jgi:hypothetical protein
MYFWDRFLIKEAHFLYKGFEHREEILLCTAKFLFYPRLQDMLKAVKSEKGNKKFAKSSKFMPPTYHI